MNNFIITIIITSTISSVTSAIVASLLTLSKAKVKKEQQLLKAFSQGIRALLWQELNNIHKYATKQQGLTPDERHNLENIYNAYHTLGGNGTGTKIYNEIEDLPVKQGV